LELAWELEGHIVVVPEYGLDQGGLSGLPWPGQGHDGELACGLLEFLCQDSLDHA